MTECVLWTGGTSEGYGQSRWGGKTERAHRVAWLKSGREIPQGMHVHHLCGNRLCVKVEHLALIDPITHGRMHNQRKDVTHCPRGHEYTPENTYIRRGKHRQCRACDRIRARDYYRRNKQRALDYRVNTSAGGAPTKKEA